MTKTNKLRYKRIIQHALKYAITFDLRHWYEIQHYWYMKRFTDVID